MWSRPREWELDAAEKIGNAPGRAELFVEGTRAASRDNPKLPRLTSAPTSPSDRGGDLAYRTLERHHRPFQGVAPRPGRFWTGTDRPWLPSSGQAPTSQDSKVQDRHRPARTPKFRTGTDRPGLQSSGQAPTGPRRAGPESRFRTSRFRTGTDLEVRDRHRPRSTAKYRTGTDLEVQDRHRPVSPS
jgi:hypothetical protein